MWTWVTCTDNSGVIISRGGYAIAKIDADHRSLEEAGIEAAEICRACNMHGQLVGAIIAIRQAFYVDGKKIATKRAIEGTKQLMIDAGAIQP